MSGKNKIIFVTFIFSILVHLILILFVSIGLKDKKFIFSKENTYIKIVDLTKLENNSNKNENKNLNQKIQESKIFLKEENQPVEEKNIVDQSKKEEKENNDNNKEEPQDILYIPNFKIDKYPEYPLKAKRLGFEGEVILKIITNNEGKILEIIVEKSTGYDILDNAAINAVKKWNFKRVILTKEREKFVFKTKIIFKLNN